MTDVASEFDPPAWTAPAALGSLVLAAASWVVGGPASRFGWPFVGVAAACTVYLLYRWGQHRDPPSGDDSDRRESEMEAEAGAYGGSEGGA